MIWGHLIGHSLGQSDDPKFLAPKFEMSTYFYSHVIWLQSGPKISTLVRVTNIFSLIIQKIMCKIAIHTVRSRDIVPRGGPLFVLHVCGLSANDRGTTENPVSDLELNLSKTATKAIKFY